jgi:hypothetical protein
VACYGDANIVSFFKCNRNLSLNRNMSNRARVRPGGQIQFSKRVKIAHPMELVLDDIQRSGIDRQRNEERQRRYRDVQDNYMHVSDRQRNQVQLTLPSTHALHCIFTPVLAPSNSGIFKGREDDLLWRFEKQTEVTVDRAWCKSIMTTAFPVLKDNARRSDRQRDNLLEMLVLMCSATKVRGSFFEGGLQRRFFFFFMRLCLLRGDSIFFLAAAISQLACAGFPCGANRDSARRAGQHSARAELLHLPASFILFPPQAARREPY